MALHRRFQTCMEGFIGQFMRDSTLHGMKFLGYQNLHVAERIFWVISMLGSLALSVHLVMNVYASYIKDPIIASYKPVESAVSQVVFPALTLCNVNILKEEEVLEAVRLVEERGQEWKNDISNTTKEAQFFDSLALLEHTGLDVFLETHYCLTAPSFKRRANLGVESFSGQEDFVEEFQKDLVNYMNSGNLSENFADNVTKEFRRNISNFVELATHDCADMILKCQWAHEDVPCKSIFRPIMTQHGGCCVFNMMPRFLLRRLNKNSTRVRKEKELLDENSTAAWEQFSDDKLFRDINDPLPHRPKYQRAGGKSNGLSILINPELSSYSTCNSNDGFGLQLVAHSPISFPNIMENGMAVPHGHEVFVDIEPRVVTAKRSDLYGFTVADRGCYFARERESRSMVNTYRFYTAANCIEDCIANFTYNECNCVRFFMPRKSDQRFCGAKMLNCSEHVKKTMTSGGYNLYCPHCKPSCTSVDYKTHMTTFPIRVGSEMHSVFYEQLNSDKKTKKATNYSILHVFIGVDSLNVLERKVLYNAWDVIAKAGGILSLTLGFSVVCIVELIYFFTFRAWHHFHSKVVEGEDERNEEMETSADAYYSSSRPRLSAVFKRKRLTGNPTLNKMFSSMKLDFQNHSVNIPPFHLLSSATTENCYSNLKK